jgi:hypothetical protein
VCTNKHIYNISSSISAEINYKVSYILKASGFVCLALFLVVCCFFYLLNYNESGARDAR